MKLAHTYIYVAISSLALLIVLIIQVNWIFKTAEAKEELFNEKANMVLSRTTQALANDKQTSMNVCRAFEEASPLGPAPRLGASEIFKIDSIFKQNMFFYNFHLDYSFEVIKPGAFKEENESSRANNEYKKTLEDMASENGLQLKLILPDKKQFIIAEMGTMFITSVILILVVMVMFWRTILSLMREKKISEHTTDFLNNMTHEFKTPLTNIALAGRMISKDPALQHEEKLKQYSEIILEENKKLSNQVEQVLSMTALERGDIPLRKTELDFHQLIQEAVQCMSLQIENRNGHLALKLQAGCFVINGDKTHLNSALSNLLDNAIKYSGEKPELIVQTSNTGNNLVVAISDNGIGIEKEYQKKVFDKFFRVPTGDLHNVKGFGLGLAYIKKIAELHGGTITLQSEKGKGSTFIITLPHV